MIIEVSPDERYEFEFSSLLASEGSMIKKATGLKNRDALMEACGDDDPDAWRAIIWILRRRHGQPDLTFDDCDFAWYIGEDGVAWPHQLATPTAEQAIPVDPEVAEAERLRAEYDKANELTVDFPDPFPTEASPST